MIPFDDKLHEECGVFGIYGHPEAAAITALGLHALQHRGQEAAGIVSFDNGRFHGERRLGLVGDHFSNRNLIERLPGNAAIGHVRYSTTGETILRNVQPLFAELEVGGIKTTAGYHAKVLRTQEFRSGKFDTSFVDRLQKKEQEAREAKQREAASEPEEQDPALLGQDENLPPLRPVGTR